MRRHESPNARVDSTVKSGETLRSYLTLTELLYILKFGALPCMRADLCFSYANMWLRRDGNFRVIGSPSVVEHKEGSENLTPLSVHAKDMYFFRFSSGSAESLALWGHTDSNSVLVALEVTEAKLSASIALRDEVVFIRHIEYVDAGPYTSGVSRKPANGEDITSLLYVRDKGYEYEKGVVVCYRRHNHEHASSNAQDSIFTLPVNLEILSPTIIVRPYTDAFILESVQQEVYRLLPTARVVPSSLKKQYKHKCR